MSDHNPGAFESAIQAWGEHRAHLLVCRRERLDPRDLRRWIDAYALEEISFSRLMEVMREWVATGKAAEWGDL